MSIKQTIRRAIVGAFPELSKPLLRFTHRRHIAQLERRLGLPRLNRRIALLTGSRIAAGPFAGMDYIDRATGSQYSPKLVGSYEYEIHPWIERALAANYDLFVDVGCAEGFYAVGFALRSPSTRVIGYDIDPKARRLTAELAAKNGVGGRIEIRTACHADTFAELPPGRLFVLCDCEGYEADLLIPDVAPRLKSADILVELHELQSPGITRSLMERFRTTHEVESIQIGKRNPADFNVLKDLTSDEQSLAVNEVRGYPQEWLMLTAKQS